MSSSSAAAPSTSERFPSIHSPKASSSSPSHPIPRQESHMLTKTEQLPVDPCAPLSDMSFNMATDVCNDLNLGVDYENDFLSPANQNVSTCLPDIPKQPHSAVSAEEAAVSSSALNTTDSKLVVPVARTTLPHTVSPRHTFHPALLGTLFTPTFITMILPPHLHNLSHSLPQPLLQQSANPAAGTSSTVTTTSVKSDANDALVSRNHQAQSDGQALTAVPQTQEERIIERNRKGRERSLRTRRRNAFRLQTLERNVVYLTTENNLLKDLVSTLSWLTQNPLSTVSDSQGQSPHPLVIPFTALLLCALSRPPPYIPNSNRQYISPFRATPSVVNNYNLPAPSNVPLQPMATTPLNMQQVKTQTETALGTLAEEQPTAKFECEEANRPDRERSTPLTEEPRTPGICVPQAELPILTSPDFKLSTDEFHFPSLNIDEIDRLLRDPTPDSPCNGTSLSPLERN